MNNTNLSPLSAAAITVFQQSTEQNRSTYTEDRQRKDLHNFLTMIPAVPENKHLLPTQQASFTLIKIIQNIRIYRLCNTVVYKSKLLHNL